ncbi:ribosome maturation factor RimM [Candidatus Liberibacter asiaticus]|uniref:Ribosome maturation factor RimM n=2 Tax=Liberibacter asiaticus TaxID=34021 RepID=C6XFN3_LIBAP|nr:ribosome maturation factor RimM [Candidatus Liberibacter asiaticus]ACT57186.1 16S rRNA-processing protein [Candidatus Liberibacter asiaticus str. psy62]AGH16851.1 16S rRNA-processing protein [Candidatus Liberibacter asiaticus str. gxpsy]ALK07209.1 16S rRNA processing protein RimM [Candidatus Liberibacter asiaticus]ASK52690.1 16S rRNA processing protein RimM [Candidatus Liberibacter asiaticus]AWL14015.1 16S rRNA processing protein RimM [Candidatus Liberibacter asiaticus]
MVKLDKLVLMATIGTTHGLNGEVYIDSYANNPIDLNRYVLYSNDNRELRILKMYRKNKRFIATFSGIDNIHSASELRDLKLYAKRQDFKDEELEEDEFFNTDLEEMETFDRQGKYWGQVCGVYNFGAGSILEIKNTMEKTFLIPFTKFAVLEVNLQENKILIDPIAAGLNNTTMKNPQYDCPLDSAGKKS